MENQIKENVFVADPQWSELHYKNQTIAENQKAAEYLIFRDKSQKIIHYYLKNITNKSNGVTHETYQIEFEKSRNILSVNNTPIPSSYVDHSYDTNQDADLAVWRYLREAEPEEPNPKGEELKQMMDNIREDEAAYEAKVALIMREVDISLADNCVG